MLLHKAIDTKSDIVVGEWCFAYENGVRTYLNLDPFRIKDYEMMQPEAFHSFLSQKDMCFSWQVVWNKLYSSQLWKNCLQYFKRYSKEHGRMQMWEDFTFSFVLWMHAAKVSNIHNAYYYYYRHSKAMTCALKSKKTCESYIQDIKGAFTFARRMLDESEFQCEEFKKMLEEYNNVAVATVRDDLYRINKLYYQPILQKSFGRLPSTKINNFFYGQSTELNGIYDQYQDIKKLIADPDIDVVSFDIFDTLLVRPFIYPTDLFDLLSNKINESTASYIDFSLIRRNAEDTVRKETFLKTPSKEEITFDEIYQQIEKECNFTEQLLDSLKQQELLIEEQVLQERKIGKELFELAKDAGKRIIITSDMYLPKVFVERMLEKNGYLGYEKLYLSSEILLTKATGNLFKYILRDLDIKNNESLLHIGDNWNSDVERPREQKIRAEHLPKSTDLYFKQSPIWGGDSFSRTFRNSGMTADYGMIFDSSPSLRSLLSLGSNKMFDNPFVSFNKESDYNDDPRYIGYYALGSYVLSIAQWAKELAVEHSIPCIHFVARDGWLLKDAFDLINDTDTTSDYIRLSRKALTLCDVNSKDDVYSLSKKMWPLNAMPEKVYQYLKPALLTSEDELWMEARKKEFYRDRRFHSLSEYERFLKFIIEKAFSIEKLEQYKNELKEYFQKTIKEGDFIFDVGYSGRTEAALSNLLGYPVGSLYLHTNGDGAAEIRQNKYGVKCYCFYPIKPAITGAIREHCLMERGPSTVGYTFSEGELKPVFENFKMDYTAELITSVLQDSAIQFVKDFKETFGSYGKYIYYNKTALAAPYEMYLHFPKEFDKYLFKSVLFEDDLNVEEDYTLYDFWNNDLRRAQLHNRLHEQTLEGLLRDSNKNTEDVYNSYSYRLGHMLVKMPGSILRKLGVIKK